MRIADILVSYVAEGAHVVDLTDDAAGLSPYAMLAPQFGLPYQRGSAPLGFDVANAIVLHTMMGERGTVASTADLTALRGLAPNVVHIVFVERIEMLIERGLLEHAAAAGFELVDSHRGVHRAFRAAVVFRRGSSDATSAWLRIVNEYRFGKLRFDELERSNNLVVRERDELRANVGRLNQEVADARAEQLKMSQAHDKVAAELAQQRGQVEVLKQNLLGTFEKLAATRRTITFRVGRATKAAVDQSRTNVLTAPRRWLEQFRGPDAVVEQMRTGISAVIKPAQPTLPSRMRS